MAMRRTSLVGSLQGLALTLCVGAVLVATTFFILRSIDDPAGGPGIPGPIADPIMMTYGPIVLSTILGFRRVLFRTYVVIHGQPPQPLILIRRGAWFLYLVGLAGIVVALAVLFMLAFHTVKLDDYKTTLSLGAGAWALTTGEVFSRFFAQLAEEAPPQG